MSSGRRLGGLIRKEWLQILRDPSSIAIAFVMPLILLLLFGYAVSLDARHVPIALVVDQPSAQTAAFTGNFAESQWIEPLAFPSMARAEQALMAGRVDAIVHLRADFARDLLDGGTPAPIQVVASGVDANTARITLGYIDGVWRNWVDELRRASGSTPTAAAGTTSSPG